MVQRLFRMVVLSGFCLLVLANVARAELSKKDILRLQDSLRTAAEKFGEAYVKRDFKMMYEMLNKKYRRRVELWEYKDYVHYDGISDGFMKVELMDVIVVPPRNNNGFAYGKVSQKISSVENVKTKATGYTSKMEEEFIYWDDWVCKDGVWYKIQKLE